MAGTQRVPLESGSTATGLQARAAGRESPAFVAGSVLLVVCVLICGVFAGLAGKEVGDQDLMFVIAFVFLGIVTVGIFALAWVDMTTRSTARDDWEFHH